MIDRAATTGGGQRDLHERELGAVTGGAAGLLFRACLTTVVQLSEVDRRAGTLATLFVTSYAGLSVPVIGLGVASQIARARGALAGFAALALVGLAAVAVVGCGRSHRRIASAGLAAGTNAGPGDVDTVLVDGMVVKRGGRLVGPVAERARQLIEESRSRVFDRAKLVDVLDPSWGA
ncbi:hypothetical protein [Micromonospora sp. NPDC005367]|uniref:hypothetical protein n=1 Tax=Micromonospora sp. NPDC005367 TaxID=3155590 RepID=UPI0033B3EDB7